MKMQGMGLHEDILCKEREYYVCVCYLKGVAQSFVRLGSKLIRVGSEVLLDLLCRRYLTHRAIKPENMWDLLGRKV